jgi:hypothetical protein
MASRQPVDREAARLIVAGGVTIALIAGGVILSAMGRPLADLLSLVGLVVMPVLVGIGAITVKNTNGNTSELIAMLKAQRDRDAEEKAQLLAQNARQSHMLATSTPPPDYLNAPTAEYKRAAA